MIENFRMHISELGSDRVIRVYLPEHYYDTDMCFPVLYLQDGKNVFQNDQQNDGQSLELEAYLQENQQTLIVVAVEQSREERRNEYCPWPNNEYSKWLLEDEHLSFGGKGHAYSEFLVQELKPYIDRKYRTKRDITALAGISLGGLITVYTAFRYPHIFKNIIIFSTAFYVNREEIEKLADEANLSAIASFYMDCGTAEGSTTRIHKEFLENNRSFYRAIKKKVPHARFLEIEGGEHHYNDFKERREELFSFLKSR